MVGKAGVRHEVAEDEDAGSGEEDVVPFILKPVEQLGFMLVREIVDWDVGDDARC